MARDPLEYRATLESIAGPSNNAVDPGRFLEFTAQTWACGDSWPIVPVLSDPVTIPPNGSTLPSAVGIPFPDQQQSPQIDWALSKLMFVGNGPKPCGSFSGAAAAFEGTIKGLSVMRHGVCSMEQSLDGLSGLKMVPPNLMALGLGIDVADFGLSSFVTYAPNGGFIVTGHVDTSELLLPPAPPIPVAASIDRNYTYRFSLDDGIMSIDAPTANISNDSGVDPLSVGSLVNGLLSNVVPNAAKLAVLDGPPGTFIGGLAQPMPAPPPIGGIPPACTITTGQRPSTCFIPCRNSDNVDMADPSTWPSPEDANDPNHIDPPSWHDSKFCGLPAALLGGLAGGATSPLGATITEPLPVATGGVDTTKFHNWRCNFHPRYESPTSSIAVKSLDPVTNAAPFGLGGTTIVTGPPVCELIVRVKRLNVFPDSVEAVFFDGTSTTAPDLSDAAGNEALAVFTGLSALVGPGAASSAMCGRQPETPGAQLLCNAGACTPRQRSFAHFMLH